MKHLQFIDLAIGEWFQFCGDEKWYVKTGDHDFGVHGAPDNPRGIVGVGDNPVRRMPRTVAEDRQ